LGLKQEEKNNQQHMPQLDGNFDIISPIAPQVLALLGFDSLETRPLNTSAAFQVFRGILENGEMLSQVLSKWIMKLTPSVVVKFAPGLDISEDQIMRYIWSHRGNIPMPEPLGAISIRECNYIFMSYIEGESLEQLWPRLSPKLKNSIQSQLGEILGYLREMPLSSNCLGNGNPPLCRDLRRHVRTSLESISTELEFNTFLTSTPVEFNSFYRDLITSSLSTNNLFVMTHSDLCPENITVSCPTPDTIRITGLIDWELNGAYPEYWEYVKGLADVRWRSND